MNSKSRTDNSVRNLTVSFVQKLVSILLTFVGRQVFLQVLSVEYLGINRLFGDIISILSLADLGLATAMAYSFYKPLAESDEDSLAALIGVYKTIYNVIAAVVAIVGVALTPFLKYIVKLDTDIPHLEVYYLITLAQTVISYLFVYKSTIITADQNSRLVNRYMVWTSITVTAVQIAVLLLFRNYIVYCLVPIFGTMANNLIISNRANKLYPFIKKKVQLASVEKRALFKNIGSMFIYKVATVIYNSTNSILISLIIGTAVVGTYANYNLAVVNLSTISLMIFSSLTPSIGNLVATEPSYKRMQVFKLMQTLSYWLSGFFIFCLFFLIDEFVALWIGAEYIFDMPIKLIMLANFYLGITLYPIIACREATGIYQKTKYVMLLGAIINIVSSIILGRIWGLPGILLSNSVSKLVTYAWYEPRILFRDYLGGRAITYLFGHIQNFLMLSACIAFTYYIIPWKESAGWLGWILKGAICAVAINVVYFLRYFRTPEFHSIIGKVKGLYKTKE